MVKNLFLYHTKEDALLHAKCHPIENVWHQLVALDHQEQQFLDSDLIVDTIKIYFVKLMDGRMYYKTYPK